MLLYRNHLLHLQTYKTTVVREVMGSCQHFSKVFWITNVIVRSIKYAFEAGNVSIITQTQGIVTCLPKCNKPVHFFKTGDHYPLL